MSISASRVSSWIDRQGGNFREGYVDITFDSSYVTGGEPIVLTGWADGVTLYDLSPVGGGAAGYEFVWDKTNAKIIVYVRSTGAQVASEFDLSGVTQRFYWRGI